MPSVKAVLYLRSSKDRADVSIETQRQELLRLASSRDLEIVREFTDVVESAKSEHRPAFQELKAALKSADRDWSSVLLLEPSRLSRNQFVAHVFTHDARTRGVKVIYARMPESNPMVDIIITPLMHGFAEYHSWESKVKGLAGMAENVKRGYRAGGRAPFGYRLQHEPTGAIREGQPVTKSRLVPSVDAPAIARYLKGRAAGAERRTLQHAAGLKLAITSLIGIELNALTYAGCTVWNVHNERTHGGYQGHIKRRPRAEWHIKEGTHEALITREEAEELLRRLEIRANGPRQRDRAPAEYLLAGVLVTPTGEKWEGCRDRTRRYYRSACPARRRISAQEVERTIVAKVAQDFKSERFLAALVRDARRLAVPDDEVKAIARAYSDIDELDRKISKVTGMLAEGIERPLLLQIGKWEAEREQIRAGVVDMETRLKHARAIAGITEQDIVQLLDNLATHMASLTPTETRDFLRGLVDRVILDPKTLHCRIHYEIPAISGDRLASPGRSAFIPALCAWSVAKVA